MYTALDILVIEIKIQEIIINVVKVEKPEYNLELVTCSCGNIIPAPIKYQDNSNRFKLLVETSGSFGLDKVDRFQNSNTGFDTFAHQLTSDIICRYPLVVTSSLILIFKHLSNDGRRITFHRPCEGCSQVATDY